MYPGMYERIKLTIVYVADQHMTLIILHSYSVSWYFLVMYGLRSFFKLVIGDPSLEVREQEMLLTQQGMQNPSNPGSKTNDVEAIVKQLQAEAENLELLANHKSEMDGVEKRLLGKRFPKKKLTTDASDFLLGSRGPKSKRKTQ